MYCTCPICGNMYDNVFKKAERQRQRETETETDGDRGVS